MLLGTAGEENLGEVQEIDECNSRILDEESKVFHCLGQKSSIPPVLRALVLPGHQHWASMGLYLH